MHNINISKENNMAIIIGFPRIGENRELKRALESYWAQKISEQDLLNVAQELRSAHWEHQKDLEFVCVNDFSFYDNMLDLSLSLGAIPERFKGLAGLELYFAMARGAKGIPALEMTKWFNTNYHYVVPELALQTPYLVNAEYIHKQYKEAKAKGFNIKISLIGIFTYLALSRFVDNASFEEHFQAIKKPYLELVAQIAAFEQNPQQITIQFDEPIFVRGEHKEFYNKIKDFYDEIKAIGINVFVSCYFEEAKEALELLAQSKIDGIALDFVYGSTKGIQCLKSTSKRLFAGVVDGRNIWATPLQQRLELLKDIQKILPQTNISVSSSCSLLHVPYTKAKEQKFPEDVSKKICFAYEKIEEIKLLEAKFKNQCTTAQESQWDNQYTYSQNTQSPTQHKQYPIRRKETYRERILMQHSIFKLPLLPTTTIGSFPQTTELRNLRRDFKKGIIDTETYKDGIKAYIRDCIALQEKIGLDVLVHGEPERNDMVEYFGEQLEGFAFSQNGWVQSYGSRCVKPPIIHNNVSRKGTMTVEWILYAQSQTDKIVKGMLTGPVTILNWSFVRDDISRKEVCTQIALAIADEINDLQNAGVKIIQVDEAAFKEGYPLRKEKVAEYEQWATQCFRIATAVAKPEVQIHTHMCYSQFNDIMESIQSLDADVISIECARSGNNLLKAFKEYNYIHEIGPGVYDIHSPQIPTTENIKKQIRAFLEVLPKEQLWINPDCGLKTRKNEEVHPSLTHMIEAVKQIRQEL